MDLVVKYYESEIRKKSEEIDHWKMKSFVLQSQCGIQEEELDAYKAKFDALRSELQEKKLDYYLVESRLKDLTSGMSTTQDDELKYKTMCDKLNQQIEELKRICKESVSEAELKLKCEVDLERRLKDCKAQYSEMYEELKRYKVTCNQLNEQNEEFKRRYKELVTQAESRLEKQVDLEKQLNEQKEEFERRSKELVTQAELRLEQQVGLEKQLNEQKEEFERRSKELAAQAESSLEKQVDLEKQLNDNKAKYCEMYVRFKEGKERVVALENDLKEYMRICGELNERVESSEDKVRATSSEAGKCIDKLTKEIVNLGDEKRKVEDESEVLKTKFRELEIKTALYMKELDDYKVKCHGLSVELKDKELEFVEYQRKLKNLALTSNAFVDELEGYKMAMNGLKEQIMGLAEDRKVFSEREKEAEERISSLQEIIKSLVEEKCNQLSKEAKSYSSPQIDRDKHVSAGIVQICSSENDKEIKPKLNVSTSKRPFLDQKGEEYGINFQAVDIPLSSAPKRERLPETVTIDSDERKMKKLKEGRISLTPNITPMNISAGDIALSSKCQNAEEYVAKLQRKLASQKMCAEKKSQADGTSKVENTLPDCLEIDGSRSSQVKVGSLTTEDHGDKVTEEAKSDSGGDSNTEDAADVHYKSFICEKTQ
ncbi:centrosomal protein of 128 kDa-like isoform X1 [Papaver somniferum]|uniref:centrosomal protein of 128 kDa-like isoform X1 n=1 Tax=Papaver somniferum TaxID=3469 RepID=UPI000E6F6FE4|nr:centrosomal protein of 128 kDa-like isoform X1 [Papaver somniferum]